MKKVLIITGARSEYGLLKPVFLEMQKSKKLKPLLLVTGMHTLKKYGHTINEIREDNIPINHTVNIGESDNMISALAKEIVGIEKYCQKNRPDLILVLGDRDEAFAGAIVGGHLGIPVAHIHGGDLTASIVDGAIRDSITKFSHLHFTACKTSYQRVGKLQEDKHRIFLVGAPGLDDIRISELAPKSHLAKSLNLNLSKPWLLFLIHPTPLDKLPLKIQAANPLKAISALKNYEKVVIYPNSDTGSDLFIKEINKYNEDKTFHIFKSLPRHYYLSLLNCVDFMIGNSSSGIIESSYFKLPVINIGNRQKYRERGLNVVDAGYEIDGLKNKINYLRTKHYKTKLAKTKNPYGNGAAGKKIVKVLENTNYDKLFYKKSTYS